MENSFYNRVAGFIQRTTAKSIDVKNELDAVSAGFDLLPAPRNDGKGFTVPVAVADATETYHAATKGQLENLIVSNQTNKDQAEAAKSEAEEAQSKAENAQNKAEIAQNAAETSVSETNQLKAFASEWAIKPEDMEISEEAAGELGKYSALHWAKKGEKNAIEAQQFKDLAEGYASGFKIPPILFADRGKALHVKPDGSGYELKASSNIATLMKFGAM
jgi:uncharacterized protein YdaT